MLDKLKVCIAVDNKAGTVALSVDNGEYAVYQNNHPIIDKLLKYLDWPERYEIEVNTLN